MSIYIFFQSGSDSEGECSSSRRATTSNMSMMTKLNEQPMFSLKHVSFKPAPI